MKDDITIAKTAGFCMGVRRAVEIAIEEANSRKGIESINTFGPLIHNPQVLELLEDKNIKCIEQIPEKGSGTIIIRAHGVPPVTKKKLKNAGFRVLDATCPRVVKVQAIIKKHASTGFKVIIAGDHHHAEVIGLLGYAEDHGVVINSMEEFDALPSYEKAIVVAQTTQNTKFYKELEKKIIDKFPNYKFFNTICDSTEKRQEEIKNISAKVDAIVVVGGKNSGNTKRLKEVALQQGTKAFHIESEKELDTDYIASLDKIGITAGASTPNWIISQVYNSVKTAKLKRGKNIFISIFMLLKFLLRFNILLAAGAAALTMAANILLGLNSISVNMILTAFLYTFSMHTINNLTLTGSDRFNDPQKAKLYEKYKYLIFLSAVISILSCFYTSFKMGIISFIIILLMSGAGLCYKLPVINIPGVTNGRESLSGIPGSKAVLIAVSWGIICTFLPLSASSDSISITKIPGIFIVFLFTASITFSRTIWVDILAIQGNKIAGETTIPIIIGEKKAFTLLIYLLSFVIILILIASSFNIISKFGFILVLYPVFALLFIIKTRKKQLHPGFFDDIITESMLLISGFLAVIWKIF